MLGRIVTRCPIIHHLPQRSFTTPTPSPPNVIVQKFGGTSLGTNEKMEKVLNIIKKFKQNNNVVVVVSALSSDNKEEGTTSRLLAAAQSAVEQKDFQTYLNQIEDTHLDIIYTLIKSGQKRESIHSLISNELNEIREFCSSLSVIRDLSPRSHDKIIGCGERMAASLTSAILNDHGYNSSYINLSNIFDDEVFDSSIMKNKLETVLHEGLPDTIPVVTGFFGQVKNGMINTIGRGYTDLTAALCAGATNAKLQVWKESDGIFTGNPTKIDDAQLLSNVTPEQASELTSFGNEVLNPFTMKCCINDNIPIQILNTFEPDKNGTVINPNTKDKKTEDDIIAVCSKKGINVLNLSIDDGPESLGLVFELFKKHNVKIDLITTSVTNISAAIHESVDMKQIKNLILDLEQHSNKINLKSDRAIVSCIGSGIENDRVGIASKIFTCLSEQDINIEMISQGSSEISISVVIHKNQMDQAIKAIHNEVVKDNDIELHQKLEALERNFESEKAKHQLHEHFNGVNGILVIPSNIRSERAASIR